MAKLRNGPRGVGRAAQETDETTAIGIMHAAIDNGLTFFDNAWDYHDGFSEELMGKALQGKRDQVFLMTKNCERDYEGSLSNLEDSLRRLQTDHIDLWQFHEMVYDNDPDWVFDKGGMKAALEAQKAGKVRYLDDHVPVRFDQRQEHHAHGFQEDFFLDFASHGFSIDGAVGRRIVDRDVPADADRALAMQWGASRSRRRMTARLSWCHSLPRGLAT